MEVDEDTFQRFVSSCGGGEEEEDALLLCTQLTSSGV